MSPVKGGAIARKPSRPSPTISRPLIFRNGSLLTLSSENSLIDQFSQMITCSAVHCRGSVWQNKEKSRGKKTDCQVQVARQIPSNEFARFRQRLVKVNNYKVTSPSHLRTHPAQCRAPVGECSAASRRTIEINYLDIENTDCLSGWHCCELFFFSRRASLTFGHCLQTKCKAQTRLGSKSCDSSFYFFIQG